MRLVSLFCLIALVLVALLLPGDYEFVLAHPTVTRSNNSNSGCKKRAMLTVAASTSANGSTGSSALELPSAASSNNINIGENSATAGTNKQPINNNQHTPSFITFPPFHSSTPSISATPTTTRNKTSTSTNATTTTTKTTTKTKTKTTPFSPITPTTPTGPITPTSMPPSSIPQTSDIPSTTSSGSNQTPALLLPPETASASSSESDPIPFTINEAQPNTSQTSQNSPVNSNSDPAASQPNGQQTDNQNPAVDTTGSYGSGSPGGSGVSGGSSGPSDSSSPGGAKATDNQNNQNFVSQGSMSNKLLGPVIGGTIATLAGFGMAFLVVVRKRKSASLGLQLQSGSWDDYDQIEPPTEPITRFRPASFLFAVRSVVNKLPLPRDSANITGESKFVEKMDFDEY